MWNSCACRPCSTLQGGIDVFTPAVEDNLQVAGFKPSMRYDRCFLKQRCLTTELLAQVVRLGAPSRFGHESSGHLLHSVEGWESNLWRDAYELMPWTTELQQ